MYLPHRAVVAPVTYDVQYAPPAPVRVVQTYDDSYYRRRSASSYCGWCCCLICLLTAIIIAAGLAVGIYYAVKSNDDGDSIKNTNTPRATTFSTTTRNPTSTTRNPTSTTTNPIRITTITDTTTATTA